jgi:hypothetical protein
MRLAYLPDPGNPQGREKEMSRKRRRLPLHSTVAFFFFFGMGVFTAFHYRHAGKWGIIDPLACAIAMSIILLSSRK